MRQHHIVAARANRSTSSIRGATYPAQFFVGALGTSTSPQSSTQNEGSSPPRKVGIQHLGARFFCSPEPQPHIVSTIARLLHLQRICSKNLASGLKHSPARPQPKRCCSEPMTHPPTSAPFMLQPAVHSGPAKVGIMRCEEGNFRIVNVATKLPLLCEPSGSALSGQPLSRFPAAILSEKH
jgi:hypothetical protein